MDSMANAMPTTPALPQDASFLARVKYHLNPTNLMQSIKGSKNLLIEVGMYLGIGFLVGFLLKKYSKYVLVALLCIAGLVVLQQFDFVTIAFNTAKIQEVFAVRSSSLQADLFSMYWDWIKINFSIVLSFSIGFLIGLKLG